ncbi:MAG TPA: DUF2063 domain-containing protein [Leucothrix mucor]|nr:DUF2063 domain-containing protein [Leucothrix mucor]
MSDLLALQRDMMQWLKTESGDIHSQVLGTKKVSVDIRLAIYANAYRYRLIDALSDNYPSVHTLLGDEGFYDDGIKYIADYPSQHFSIRYFGSHLEAFLKDHHQETGVLAEMARFEWALRDAFDAKDLSSLGLDALQTVAPNTWADLGFVLHPSVARVDLQWNVPQLWAAIEDETGEIPIEEAEYPIPWIIWRKDLKTYYRSVDVDEAWALDNVIQGASFSEICAGVCEWIDEEHAPARVAGFISTWLAADMIVELKVTSF